MPKKLRYKTLIKDLPPELLNQAEELRKAKVPVYKIAEIIETEKAKKSLESNSVENNITDYNEKLPNPFVGSTAIPTRANYNHSYYQYIHPVKLASKIEDFEYAFFIVSKEGLICRSQNYKDKLQCHTDLLNYLEHGVEVPLIVLGDNQ